MPLELSEGAGEILRHEATTQRKLLSDSVGAALDPTLLEDDALAGSRATLSSVTHQPVASQSTLAGCGWHTTLGNNERSHTCGRGAVQHGRRTPVPAPGPMRKYGSAGLTRYLNQIPKPDT
eukprot:223817-Chlamydomonas_euryale.AAC.3